MASSPAVTHAVSWTMLLGALAVAGIGWLIGELRHQERPPRHWWLWSPGMRSLTYGEGAARISLLLVGLALVLGVDSVLGLAAV